MYLVDRHIALAFFICRVGLIDTHGGASISGVIERNEYLGSDYKYFIC